MFSWCRFSPLLGGLAGCAIEVVRKEKIVSFSCFVCLPLGGLSACWQGDAINDNEELRPIYCWV